MIGGFAEEKRLARVDRDPEYDQRHALSQRRAEDRLAPVFRCRAAEAHGVIAALPDLGNLLWRSLLVPAREGSVRCSGRQEKDCELGSGGARASSIATSAECRVFAAPVTGARIFSGPETGSLSWTPRAIATARGPSNERANFAISGLKPPSGI